MSKAVLAEQCQRSDHTGRLDALRARVRRALEDPRAPVAAQEAEAALSLFMAKERDAGTRDPGS